MNVFLDVLKDIRVGLETIWEFIVLNSDFFGFFYQFIFLDLSLLTLNRIP